MQCATLAQLVTDTLDGLGNPSVQYVHTETAARAVVHSIALLKQSATFSRQNLDVQTYEWDAASREEQLLALDAALPLWVERKVDTDYWQFVPTCNLSVLEDARLRSEFRCAFFNSDGILKVRFSYEPTDLAYATHRLRYCGSVFMVDALNDTVLNAQGTGIPENFWPLLTGLAELELIPTMKIKAAQEDIVNLHLINAWTDRQEYLVSKVAVWRREYQKWTNGERGSIRGRRRRPILVRGVKV